MQKRRFRLLVIFAAVMAIVVIGAGTCMIAWKLVAKPQWHELVGWKAEDYFDDQQVIELCHAIESNDIEEMERLIAAGADANAVGRDGMTLLLWAFPSRKLERFACLLQHGADPNVFLESDFGVRFDAFHPAPKNGYTFRFNRGCHPGQTVTLLACASPVIEYLELVLAYQGDVNLADKKTGETPLDIVLNREMPDRKRKAELLVANNAKLNRYCKYKLAYPAMQAVNNDDFDIAIYLLKSGADPTLYQPNGIYKLAHLVIRKEERLVPLLRKKRLSDYKALVDWLEQHGESLDQARIEDKRWTELFRAAPNSATIAGISERIIAERLARQSKIEAGLKE